MDYTYNSGLQSYNYLQDFITEKVTECDIGKIYTYMVKPIKNGKLMLDDFTYQKYPELVDIIPRGFSILVDKNGIEICRLDGLKKFSGKTIMDDDSSVDCNLIDYDKIKNWENSNELLVKFQEKANGKLCIFKLFEYNNEKYILGGSKNVHRVYLLNSYINGNNLHDLMIKKVQKDIEQCDNTLHSCDLVRQGTVICEYCDGKHIVYTKTPYITYFYPEHLSNIKYVYQDQAYLPTKEQLDNIRNLENTEGVVIMYYNKKSGELYRQKFKTIWYILIRVIRQKLSMNNVNIKPIIKKRSDDFLHLTDNQLQYWYKLSDDFIEFMKKKQYGFSSVAFQTDGIAIYWNEFMTLDWKNLKVDKIEHAHTDKHLEQLKYYGENLLSFGNKVCFIMRGVSGSGKSTFCKDLQLKYKFCEIFSTDSLFETDHGYNFDITKLNEYHNQTFNNFSKSSSQLICVDNTNLLFNDFNRYIKLAKEHCYITIILNYPLQNVGYYLQYSQHVSNSITIDKQIKKYKKTTIKPCYYGLFINKEQLPEFNIIQKTPLHVTCSMNNCDINCYGKNYPIQIKYINNNNAGRCLVVELLENPCYDSLSIPHITLETYKGFKPVDVGKNINNGENIEIKNKIIYGIYGPIY